MVGLGCEVFQIGRMKERYGIVENDLFRSMTIQATGGTRKSVEMGVEHVKAMLPLVNAARARDAAGERAHAGAAVRRLRRLFRHHRQSRARRRGRLLVRNGGTAILSETPEIYGAEHLFTRRAATPRDRRKTGRTHPLVGGLHRGNGGEMNNNPSPGNKAGGLTTILEKSLGAAAKGGTTRSTASIATPSR